jgi:glucokinase
MSNSTTIDPIGATTTYIVGDIGGTNARLHLVETTTAALSECASVVDTDTDKKQRHSIAGDAAHEKRGQSMERVLLHKTYPSEQYEHLNAIVAEFLQLCSAKLGGDLVPPRVCVLAVAGPVLENKAHFTNLDWFLDGEQMAKMLKLDEVVLINDFVANGYGLLALGPDDLHTLRDKPSHFGAPIACIGAGTGLGETFLTFNGAEYEVWPAEGGHASFAPRTPMEFKLQHYIKKRLRLGNVSTERIVSGSAMPIVYEFFCRQHPNLENKEISEEIRTAREGGRVIHKYGASNQDTLCSEVISLFIQLYGAESGDLCLKTLPLGGLYVAGGIAPSIIDAMKHQDVFIESMVSKGRMRPLLEKIPVHIVLEKKVGLIGARVVARRHLRHAQANVQRQILSKL